MKHTIHIAAVFLYGFVLFPAEVQGQVHFSINPQWIQDTCFLDHLSRLPVFYSPPVHPSSDIDVTYKGEIYVVGNRCLEKFDSFGNNMETLNEEFVFYSQSDYTDHLYLRYTIASGNKYVYINEGFDSYPDPYLIDEIYYMKAYGGHLTVGGLGIVAYNYLNNDENPFLIIPGTTFESPMDFGVRGDVLGLATDAKDNIYVSGIYNNSLPDLPLPPDGALYANYIPVGTINAGGDIDIFLASYTPEGVLRWSRRIALPDYEYPENWNERQYYLHLQGIPPFFFLDNNGNTYLFGYFRNGTVFGEGQPNKLTLPVDSTYSGTRYRVIASYDIDGNLRWVRTPPHFGVVGEEVWPVRLTVDNEGNIFILWGYIDLDPALLDTDPFEELPDDAWNRRGDMLAKHASDGTVLWVRPIDVSVDQYHDLVTDARGHVYVAGDFRNHSIQVGDVTLYNHDGYDFTLDGFVANFDDLGELLWVGHATGLGAQSIQDLAVSPTGDLYVAGYSAAPFKLGSETHAQGGFLAKYAASTITSSEPVPEIPATAVLASNYPNPFTHATTIEYALPASGPVRLAVYDALGREVATLAEGVQHAGRHTAVFDGTSLPSGVYLYRLETATGVNTGLMTLRK